MCHLKKPIYNYKNRIPTPFYLDKPSIKFIDVSTKDLLDNSKRVYKS